MDMKINIIFINKLVFIIYLCCLYCFIVIGDLFVGYYDVIVWYNLNGKII